MVISYKNLIVFLLFIFAINIPNFVAYDVTGITRIELNNNLHAILRVALFVCVLGCVAIVLSFRGLKVRRKVLVNLGPFFILFFYYLLGFFYFADDFRDFASFYRIFEWFLLLFMILLLVSSYSDFGVDDYRRFLLYGGFSLSSIILFGLVFFPDLSYQYSPENNYFRLGKYLVSSNVLGVVSGLCVAASILEKSVFKRWLLISFFSLVLILTYSRGAIFGFFVALVSYVFFFSRPKLKFLVILICVVSSIFLSNTILSYLSRGQGVENLKNLSERTQAWDAALYSFLDNPLFGSGYEIGTKVIGDYFKIIGVDHWYVTTAHNDILQSMVAGGVISLILTLYLIVRPGIALLFRHRMYAPAHLFLLWMCYVQLVIYSILTPLINISTSLLGAYFVILYLLVGSGYQSGFKK